MQLGLSKKTTIVMGASKGLGKAVALALAREGASVVIGARNTTELEKTAREIKEKTNGIILAVATNAAKETDLKNIVKKTIEQFGKIDIVITNAGGPPAGTFEEVTEDMWQKAFEQTLLSAVRLIRLTLPYMKKQKSGRIINMVSTSVKQPIENLLLSNSIRTAVVGMAKTLATELASYNITVNNVCPGRFLTDRIRELYKVDEQIKQGLSEQKILEKIAHDIPMKRLGEVREFGALVAFLASEKAGYITGTTIQIDGGLTKSLL